MSVPVIGGAVLLKLTKLASDGIPDGLLVPMIVGIIAAGISGQFQKNADDNWGQHVSA